MPQFFGIPLRPVVGANGQTRWGISLQAEALLRMQSPVLANALPPDDDLPATPDPGAPPPDHICNAGTENRSLP
ncbi:MAG: hypothetical protein ACYDCX_04695 [Acidithiobacillus sp.]